MQNLFSEFPAVTEHEWIKQIEKDLKGKTIRDTLVFNDDIEEISYTAFTYSHGDTHENPGNSSYTRSAKKQDNSWEIIARIRSKSAKELNEQALDLLMKGNTGLTIDLGKFSSSECDTATKGIELNYIVTNFNYHTIEQRDWLEQLIEKHSSFNGYCNYHGSEKIALLPNCRNSYIDASLVQRAGGNTSQELAYALHKGHNALFELMEQGHSCDDASAQLHFNFGIGSNYFFEITKFRVFRQLWSKIVQAYQPKHTCSSASYISAETGLLNKSLNDPNTNLLRQTTEAMSAILGSVNELTVVPFDWKSMVYTSSKSQRLATNISLILKEESYLDKVIDPIGGSYSIELLRKEVKNKTWGLFLALEKEGVSTLQSGIKSTVKKRILSTENKNTTLIGVNKYFNPKKEETNWLPAEEFEIGTELILERDCKLAE